MEIWTCLRERVWKMSNDRQYTFHPQCGLCNRDGNRECPLETLVMQRLRRFTKNIVIHAENFIYTSAIVTCFHL